MNTLNTFKTTVFALVLMTALGACSSKTKSKSKVTAPPVVSENISDTFNDDRYYSSSENFYADYNYETVTDANGYQWYRVQDTRWSYPVYFAYYNYTYYYTISDCACNTTYYWYPPVTYYVPTPDPTPTPTPDPDPTPTPTPDPDPTPAMCSLDSQTQFTNWSCITDQDADGSRRSAITLSDGQSYNRYINTNIDFHGTDLKEQSYFLLISAEYNHNNGSQSREHLDVTFNGQTYKIADQHTASGSSKKKQCYIPTKICLKSGSNKIKFKAPNDSVRLQFISLASHAPSNYSPCQLR